MSFRRPSAELVGSVIVFGVGALVLRAFERSGVAPIPGASSSSDIWGDGWRFPVPDLELGGNRYPATATQEFKSSSHPGLDIMYARRASPAADRTDFPAGVVDAFGARQATKFFAPPETPILAAKDARVWFVGKLPNGIMVILDHGAPWATAYFHLRSTPLAPHASGKKADGTQTHVAAGEQIGVMGHAPTDAEKLRHLHFEAWFGGKDSKSAQDPTPVLSRFARSTWQT